MSDGQTPHLPDGLILSVSGMRGIVGKSLTPQIATRYASILGGWFAGRDHSRAGRPLVVVARDGRAGAMALHHAVLAGLTGAGCDALDLGIATTPTAGVLADEHDASGAVIITASHNPQQWNGIKCLARDAHPGTITARAPNAQTAGDLVERFRSGHTPSAPWNAIGRVEHFHGAAVVHVDAVLDRIGPRVRSAIRSAHFTVILDSVNTSGSLPGALLLEELGCTLIPIGNETTGVFPHLPEPTADHLQGLCSLVRDHAADIGFAQDPDADRLAIVDEHGTYIGEEYTLALATLSALELMDDRASECVLATNLSTSRMIQDVAARFNARVIRTAVGEANVVDELRQHDYAFGGEGNGGVIWPAVTFVRDSVSAIALVLALAARRDRTISELVAEINALSPSGQGYSIAKRKIELHSPEQAREVIDRVAQRYAHTSIDRRDGAWIDLPEQGAWLHVRASNTEPIVRLIAEAPTPELAHQLIAQD